LFSDRKICRICLGEWTRVRSLAFDVCKKRFGDLCPETHHIFIKTVKRLESINKKNPEKFIEIVDSELNLGAKK